MTIDTHDGTDNSDHMAELIAEAAERATPEDDSHDGAETLAQARTRANANGALLAQLGRMLADAIGPEGRHGSGKEDLAADLDLLVSRLRPAPVDLEALASSEAVQAIIDQRLAQERERNAEDLRRFVAWVMVGSLTLGLGLGLGLAQIVAWVAS